MQAVQKVAQFHTFGYYRIAVHLVGWWCVCFSFLFVLCGLECTFNEVTLITSFVLGNSSLVQSAFSQAVSHSGALERLCERG